MCWNWGWEVNGLRLGGSSEIDLRGNGKRHRRFGGVGKSWPEWDNRQGKAENEIVVDAKQG